MSVQLPSYPNRERTAALLETPARALVASDGDELNAWADLRIILAELDAIDAAAAAERRNDDRRSELKSQARAELVIPAPADARCSNVKREQTWDRVTRASVTRVVTHAAKVLVQGTPYCLTHGKLKAERAVDTAMYTREAERQARGEWTPDELLIIARRDAVDARRARL